MSKISRRQTAYSIKIMIGCVCYANNDVGLCVGLLILWKRECFVGTPILYFILSCYRSVERRQNTYLHMNLLTIYIHT